MQNTIQPDPSNTLEYDWREYPAEPDVVGAIAKLEAMRERLPELADVLEMLQPRSVQISHTPSFDHRGHWEEPDDQITVEVEDVFKIFHIPELWAYDRQEYIPVHGGPISLLIGFNPGPLEIWGRMIIKSGDVTEVIMGDDRHPPRLVIRAGDSTFWAKTTMLRMDESGIYKIDWRAIKSENFGHSVTSSLA